MRASSSGTRISESQSTRISDVAYYFFYFFFIVIIQRAFAGRLSAPCDELSRLTRLQGTQFTCFTGTKVQILTQKALLDL